VLSSLSRLMADGIGEGRTRDDHPDVAKQLYAAVARVERARGLASIIGTDELTDVERTYLRFGERFERELVAQRRDESRTIAQTLDRAWSVLRELPRAELTRIGGAVLTKYFTS
jgi:V/A-type H+-transporting ATPase subunit B